MYAIGICIEKINDQIKQGYRFYDDADQVLYLKIRKSYLPAPERLRFARTVFSDNTIDALNLVLRGMWKGAKPLVKPIIFKPALVKKRNSRTCTFFDQLNAATGSIARKGNI